MSGQIDYNLLKQAWDDAAKAPEDRMRCHHQNAVSVDQDGVYRINCKQCGAAGATNEAGARALGWIPVASVPSPVAAPDFSAVTEMVKQHVAAMSKPDYCEDNDTAHYIYEAAMEAVYGKEIWAWVRQVRK